MSFEPLYEECIDPKTKKICPAYKVGNGWDWISKCLIDENRLSAIELPEWCPLRKNNNGNR